MSHNWRWIAAGLVAIGAVPVSAQLFGGVVHDPINWGVLTTIAHSNASQLVKATEMAAQLVKMYDNGVKIYNHGVAMSQQLSHADRMMYVTTAQHVFQNETKNMSGKTGVWSEAVNGDPTVAPQAWGNATTAVNLTADLLAKLPGSSRLRSDLASLETTDSMSVQCLQAVAEYQKNAKQNQNAIQKLLKDVLNDTPAVNSFVEQLNMLNAANQQHMTEAQAQGQLHACEVQQGIIANSYARNQQAELFDNLQNVEQERETGAGAISGIGEALKTITPH